LATRGWCDKEQSEPILVDADPARITQVIVNLLTNAAKYTNEGAHIALAVEQLEGQAILRVKDDGIGITPEMLPRVFDLFAQSELTLGHARGGLGKLA
jgi:signal transduction histidine kinase